MQKCPVGFCISVRPDSGASEQLVTIYIRQLPQSVTVCVVCDIAWQHRVPQLTKGCDFRVVTRHVTYCKTVT